MMALSGIFKRTMVGVQGLGYMCSTWAPSRISASAEDYVLSGPRPAVFEQSQRLQYALVKEYGFNHTRDPTTI